jgi:predicted ribosome quality control (RQC) complex YloA/Tae2 family protein
MYNSYYYLNRLAIELNSLISGKKILNIFSQEKDRLILQLFKDADIFLEISVNHSEPYINVRNKFSRAKKNTITFFDELLNATIISVLLASDDRIIKIVTENGELLFAIRGKYTNLFYTHGTSIRSFKHEDKEILSAFLVEFSEKEFINVFNLPDLELFAGKDINDIRTNLRFIGREIENEVNARKFDNENDADVLLSVLNDIASDKPAVFVDEISNEVHIGFSSLKIFSGFKKETFESIVIAFNNYLIRKYQLEEKHNKLKKINSFIDKELKKLSSKLNNLMTVIEKGSQEVVYNKIANLLLINLNIIKPGNPEIELDDIYDTNAPAKRIKIKLESKLSPQKNADKYFEKARDSKINFEKSARFYSESKKEFDKLKSYQQSLLKNNTVEEINMIMKELKIKDDVKSNIDDDLSSKFKHYLIDNKYHVYVGKDSTNNDLLTTKFAKQNDFWFHARSVSGSHVVLRIENTKEVIPKNILKKIASLAAYHSKAKTAGVVPVSYTLKKYVIKRKGMPVGQVSLLKEEVLLIKPEIPATCEYLTE